MQAFPTVTVLGPPGPSPQAQAVAAKLGTLSPVEQQAYIDYLMRQAQQGSTAALDFLQDLARLPDSYATPQGGTKPDVAKAFLQNLPSLITSAVRVGAQIAFPPAVAVFKTFDFVKLVTGGRVDIEYWFHGSIDKLMTGDIGGFLTFAPGQALKAARYLVCEMPFDLMDSVALALTGRKMDGWLKAVILPIPFLLNEIIRFFEKIFGTAPCEWTKRPSCTTVLQWDGSKKRVHGDCCNPLPSGIGVMLVEHAPGYRKFPGYGTEIPAGDYVSVSLNDAAKQPPLVDGMPNLAIGLSGISGVLVPPGYTCRVYDQPRFNGRMVELGPGTHNLHEIGMGDAVQSAQVRGQMTATDFMYGQKLTDRTAGWITAWMPRTPTREEVLALVFGDPQRPKDNTSFDGFLRDWKQTWNPGWATNLEQMKLLDLPKTKEILQALSIKDQDLDTSRMVARWLERNQPTPAAATVGYRHRFAF